MKKLIFLFGVAVGFLLGSKVGHEPYARFEKRVREFADRPEVQSAMENAKGAAQDQVEQMSDKFPVSGAGRNTPPAGSSVLERTGAAFSR